MNPIAGFLTGLAGGALQSQVTRMEEDRQAQLRSGKMIMDMVLSTGDVTPMKMLDQKILKSFGVDPAQIDALGQMLAPIRQEREAKLGMQQAQMGVAQAQQRKLGAEASEAEATSAMIGGLSPEDQVTARVPEIGKAKVAKQQADAATTSAQASMVRADKDLSFDQHMAIVKQQGANALASTLAGRAASGGSGKGQELKEEQQQFKEVKTQFEAANKELLSAGRELRTMGKTKGGQLQFADEPTAKAAVDMYNRAVQSYNTAAGVFSDFTKQRVEKNPVARVVAIPGMLYGVKGYTISFDQPEGQAAGATAPAAPSAKGGVSETDRSSLQQSIQRMKEKSGAAK